MKTPILFITFNRPEQTERVFAEIRKIQPEKLFIAADGPRDNRPEDVEKCAKTRKIIEKVDWPCDLKTLFQDKNLGCKIGATTAIGWFFDHVEEGIILEDDCIPDKSFFPFCAEMLNYFRNKEKIIMICGYNINEKSNIPYSYTFSRYGHLWGWASWRRVWKQYDVTMKIWESKENQRKIKKAMGDRQHWNYRQWLYNETYHGRKDTWDYQWESYRLLHNQLSIIPATNMIENIGFGADATHTKQTNSHLLIKRRAITFPIVHNSNIIADDNYDKLLRPPNKAPSMWIRNIKEMIKTNAKDIVPPLLYRTIRQILLRQIKFRPRWNTLQYKSMEGVQMYFDPSGSWQKKMLDGSYDKFLFDRLRDIGASNKVIYDIGAHVGYHSLYFARMVGEGGKIFAFEPNNNNLDRIKLNLDHNKDLEKRIKIFNIAISDEYGNAEFNINNDIESGRSSGNFIGGAHPFWSRDVYKIKGFIKTRVKTIPIDMFREHLDINSSPDIIKLDVEGAEYLALKGAKNTLLSKRPIIFIEIHSMQSMFEVITFLTSLSYSSRIIHVEDNGVCYIEAQKL
ncbi:MAG: FkbM family methyltransferase [Candidatus Paceibacterota bacterium]|jgi:FkbM family methyltransferase